jgi:3-hydroxy-9,10-secoandrosta-1,3,5(10)-triene-9,17-dione monooxygenase
MSSKTTLASTSPRPAVSVDQAVTAARNLRPRLIAEQRQTEVRTRHSPQLQEDLVQAGVYHLLRPRSFGGFEFDVPAFLKVMGELARGCMSTAWSVCLASGHNLQAASWWPEDVQREVFSGEYFAAPSTIVPGGRLVRDGSDWIVDSVHPYASGAPYASHFIGHAMIDDEGDRGRRTALFIAPRASWSMVDDWGATLGLRGSGSNTVRFQQARLPSRWVLENCSQIDMDVSAGTPGLVLHSNPMYAGRALGFFGLELAVLAVGAVWAALDEYEDLLLTRKASTPPFGLRAESPDYAAWYGSAYARLCAAQAAADRGAEMFMECCRRGADGGPPFGYADDVLINMLAREALTMAWRVMEDTVARTAGSSAFVRGSRLERIWRDMTMAWSHANSILRDEMSRSFAHQHLIAARGGTG